MHKTKIPKSATPVRASSDLLRRFSRQIFGHSSHFVVTSYDASNLVRNNPKLAIPIVVICTIFTTIGQLLFKQSSVTFSWNVLSILTNYSLILGFLSYGLGALLLILSLRYGKLSVIYPFVALTFVWVAIGSYFFFNESFTVVKVLGILFIILGTVYISRGAQQ
jgi:uncharacterized membrane protein